MHSNFKSISIGENTETNIARFFLLLMLDRITRINTIWQEHQ